MVLAAFKPIWRVLREETIRSLVQQIVREALGRALLATPLKRLLLWIQLRTRAIDDIVTARYRDGGRQIVILGAGYDSRGEHELHALGL